MAYCSRNVEGCRAAPHWPRHSHPSRDLNATEVRCPAGHVNWVLWFGHGMPAVVVCAECNYSVNLADVLTADRQVKMRAHGPR